MNDLFKDTNLQMENMRLQTKLRQLERQAAEDRQMKQALLDQLKNYYAKLTDALLANKKLHHQVNHLRNKYNRLWLEKHDQQLSELEKKVEDCSVADDDLQVDLDVRHTCYFSNGKDRTKLNKKI